MLEGVKRRVLCPGHARAHANDPNFRRVREGVGRVYITGPAVVPGVLVVTLRGKVVRGFLYDPPVVIPDDGGLSCATGQLRGRCCQR